MFRPGQYQDVLSVSDSAGPDVQLSVCEWMLSHVKAHLSQCLALSLVDRDRITQPEWELPPFHSHSTPGQREAKHDPREQNSLCSSSVSTVTNLRLMSRTMTLVLFMTRSSMEMLRITRHRQFNFSFRW